MVRFLRYLCDGEEGGTAIAQTLSGDNNPAGRLPLTFYSSLDQLPSFEEYSMAKRTYRYFAGQPLYGFGYGLSYSRFGYANLKLSGTSVKAGDPLTLEADVTNLSTVAGDDVVEAYLTQPKAALTPVRSLCGFARIHVEAGKTTHVAFKLDPRVLSQVDEKGERAICLEATKSHWEARNQSPLKTTPQPPLWSMEVSVCLAKRT